MSDSVKVEQRGAVLSLGLNRPAKKNAITWEMYDALTEALTQAVQDASVRVVQLGGAGGNFTSGSDLDALSTPPPDDQERPGHRFLKTLASFEKPLVASVRGYAIGVGATLLLHTDMVYAAPGSVFRFPFVSLGLVPEGASTLTLPRLAGFQRASELLLLGEPFDAETAWRIGLVNKVLAEDELDAAVEERVQALAAMPPAAVRATKKLIRHGQAGVEARLDEEYQVFRERLDSAEFAEAVQAFGERRPPRFPD